ncbi:MAG: aminopeptidase P family N-terminal domain-containing protein [Pseudomonadota bacterium]
MPPDPAPTLAFEGEEYVRRLASLRMAMDEAGLDALILSDPANMRWLTGAAASPVDGPGGHAAVLATLSGAPLWWGPEAALPAAKRSCWMADGALRAFAAPEQDGPHPFSALADLLLELKLGRARIGVELDAPRFTAAGVGALLARCGNAQYLDATGLANGVRLVKSAAEIALIREAAALSEAVHGAIREEIRPGVSCAALTAEIARALHLGFEESGGAAPAVPASFDPAAEAVAPGLAPALAAAPAAAASLAAGAPVVIAIPAAQLGYHALEIRSASLGPVEAEAARTEAALRAAMGAALAAAAPGAPAGLMAEAGEAALAAKGIEGGRVAGAAIGLAAAPEWREGSLAVDAGAGAPTPIGATLHLCAEAPTETGLLRLGRTILMTEEGAEPLSGDPEAFEI